MANEYYEFFCPVKMVAGFKALEHISYELTSHGASRPLVITDRGVRAVGLVDIVVNAITAADMQVMAIFDEVPPDSSMLTVAAIAALYRQKECDSILAIGGGSVIDTAKGVNILVSEGGDDIRQYAGAGILQRPLKPFFVIPTTSGTGSETTSVSVIKDDVTGAKVAFVSHFLLPNAAILDPRMTLSLPPTITAATGMDALTHAVEASLCLAKNPISDAYAASAIKKITKHLPEVLNTPDDANGRLELAQASSMAGIAFSNSMVGMVHSLGHSVGAKCHVPHGVCMSILMPFVLEFNIEVIRENLAELLLHLAGPEVYAATPLAQRAEKSIATIVALKEQMYDLAKLPRTLSETGKVNEADLSEIARMALDDGSMMLNPIDATFEQALAVLRKAF